jgi:hypothetical protein
MLVIALTGPKGSGKDTVADIIYRKYKQDWFTVNRTAFADPIKQVVQHIFNLSPHGTHQYDAFKRTDITFKLEGHMPSTVPGRHVVREIGMLMRNYDEKQFNKYVYDKVTSGNFNANRIEIITDLRFDNEYTMLKNDLGAKIVKIKRPDYHYDGHITERGFDDELVDYVINNTGSLVDLHNQTIAMVDKFIQEKK